VPAVGYRVYEIRDGAGLGWPDAATVDLSSGRIESGKLALVLDASGAITSLVDKTQGDLELAAEVNGRWLNDLGGSGGDALEVENAGAVSVTLKASSTSPLQHSTRVTLYLDSGQAVVENEILQNFGGVETWGFGLALDQPVARHEEVGAILTARLASQGGHYSDRAQNSRYDWLSLGHFVDVSSSGGPGLTISNADCQFFQLGASQVASLDTATPSVSVLAGGLVVGGDPPGIFDQGGDSHFLQRFALAPHAGYDPVQAMKSALEHQNPLVCGLVTSAAPALPADVHSAFASSDPEVLLWALKPAEEGPSAGFIARLWNVTDASRASELQLAPNALSSAARTTHIETNLGELVTTPTGVAVSFAPHEIRTLRLRVD
jgi:alpha-mannosidase